ncbi:MAG: hypothetical protein ACREM2_07220 [Vulcanimicrobiaceae bacterium]
MWIRAFSLAVALLGLPRPTLPLAPITATAGVCGDVIVHANAAIAAVRADDDELAQVVRLLEGDELASPLASPRGAGAELERAEDELTSGAARGRNELARAIGRVRPEARPAAVGFARSLEGALSDQADDAHAIGSFLDARERAAIRGDTSANPSDMGPSAPPLNATPDPLGPGRPASDPFDSTNRDDPHALAREIAGHAGEIRDDEANAQAGALEAVGGC